MSTIASGADGQGVEDGAGGVESMGMQLAYLPVLARWFGRSVSEGPVLAVDDQLLIVKHLKGKLITKEVTITTQANSTGLASQTPPRAKGPTPTVTSD